MPSNLKNRYDLDKKLEAAVEGLSQKAVWLAINYVWPSLLNTPTFGFPALGLAERSTRLCPAGHHSIKFATIVWPLTRFYDRPEASVRSTVWTDVTSANMRVVGLERSTENCAAQRTTTGRTAVSCTRIELTISKDYTGLYKRKDRRCRKTRAQIDFRTPEGQIELLVEGKGPPDCPAGPRWREALQISNEIAPMIAAAGFRVLRPQPRGIGASSGADRRDHVDRSCRRCRRCYRS